MTASLPLTFTSSTNSFHPTYFAHRASSLSHPSCTGPVAGSGFFLLALVWLGTTGAAYVAARKRDFDSHRRWMIRSAALTFAAVTLRLYLGLTMAGGLPFDPSYTVIAWACWVPNLIAVELWARRGRKGRKVTAAAL